MTDAARIEQDLHYVRGVLARREHNPAPTPILYVWAVYVLAGYTMIDFAPAVSEWFFMFGGIAGGFLCWIFGRQHARREGEYDRAKVRRMTLHWMVGILLSLLFTFALAAVIPSLRGTAASQVLVVMIGLVYFLAGVHFDRQFLWLGPVLMIGGVLVGLAPRYGWTCLGAIIAMGLVVPTFFRHSRETEQHDSIATPE
ncbi:MAG TPA: hypothetical protein VFE47_10470 [Tepidisphaeraceae bacterium]|jgi:hypothetical protein|nr:hypothetical protein [Tepidisphaeraceae bacterium]